MTATVKEASSVLSRLGSAKDENRLFYVGLGAAILAVCLLALPLFRGSVYTCFDLINYHLPMRYFYAQCLASGDGFAWLPNVFCGFYLQGDGQAGMYHPLHLLLYKALPFAMAFCLDFLFNYLFVLAGMFLFLRRWQLRRDASMFGALVFTLSGFNLLHFMHMNSVAVTAHIPWALLAIDAVVRSDTPGKRAFGVLGLGLVTASELLLGSPQSTWLSLLTEALYASFLTFTQKGYRQLIPLGLAKGAGILAGSVQALPTLDVLSTSVRETPTWEYLSWPSLHPINIVQLIAPYFFKGRVYDGIPHELAIYTGAVTSVLLVFLVTRRKHLGSLRPIAMSALAMAALALILAFGKYGGMYRLQTFLPIVGLIRAPCRYILLFQFAAAAASAVAFAEISKLAQQHGPPNWRELWPVALVPLASILLLAFSFFRSRPYLAPAGLIILGPVLLAAAAAMVISASCGARYALAGVILFTAFDQGVYGLSYVWSFPAEKIKSHERPGGMLAEVAPYRIQSKDNTLIMKGVRLASGLAPLTPKPELDELSEARLRVANVQYVSDTLPDGRAYGWPVLNPLPRVRLVSKALVSSDPGKDIDVINVESTALVTRKVDVMEGTPGKVEIKADRPDKIEMATDAGSRQLLVFSETYHQGWQARVDGTETEVLRVYGDFMGCIVDAGKHEIEFVFHPKSLRTGAWLSVLGLALIITFAAAYSMRKIPHRIPC